MAETPPRKHHSGERRAQILEAAVRTFADRGFDGASMRDIAREVGITEGLIYHYFTSKEHLLHACWEEHSWHAHLERILSVADGKPLRDVLHDLGHDFLRSLRDNDAIVRVCSAELLRKREFGADFVERIEQGQRRLCDFLTARQASGEVRADVDVRIVGGLLLGTAHSLFLLWGRDAKQTALYSRLLLTEGIDVIVRGISLDNPPSGVVGGCE